MPCHTKEKCLQWAFVEHDFRLHLVHIHIMDSNEVCPSYVGVPLRRSSKAVVAAWLSDMPLSMQHKAPRWLSHPTDLQRSIQNLFAISTPAEFSHEIFANCSLALHRRNSSDCQQRTLVKSGNTCDGCFFHANRPLAEEPRVSQSYFVRLNMDSVCYGLVMKG